mgnify:CR=1 FL=1
MADGDLYECKGGYDWGGAHDGLIIHLDKNSVHGYIAPYLENHINLILKYY